MPQTVEIPDHGTAEFPDEMSQDDIASVIKKQFYDDQPPAIPDSQVSPSAKNLSSLANQERLKISGAEPIKTPTLYSDLADQERKKIVAAQVPKQPLSDVLFGEEPRTDAISASMMFHQPDRFSGFDATRQDVVSSAVAATMQHATEATGKILTGMEGMAVTTPFLPNSGTAQEKMDWINKSTDPLVQWARQAPQTAKELFPVNPLNEKNPIVQAAGVAGDFAPVLASGPFAPFTIAMSTAGQHITDDYQQLVKSGVDPETAARQTFRNAAAGGLTDEVIWSVLPAPLRAAGDKFLIDKFGAEGVKRFVLGRVAQAGEGAVLGAMSRIGQNTATGHDMLEGVGQSAGGLSLAMVLTPRGRSAGELAPGAKAGPTSLSDTLFNQLERRKAVIPNAIEKGQITESSVTEHPSTEEGRPTTTPSSSDSTQQGGTGTQEIAPGTPKIVSTAITDESGKIVTGDSWNASHDSFTKKALEEGVDPEKLQRGFVAEDANGQRHFVDREEAAIIAKDAGQAAGDVTQLHSENLNAEARPRLLPGEKQGDLISSTQPEDFKLVGEKGVDTGAQQAATDAATQRASEAKAKADHEQGLLSDFQEHQAKGGDELLDAVKGLGGLKSDGGLAGELQNIREEAQARTDLPKRTTKGGEPDARFKSTKELDNLISDKGMPHDQLTQSLKAKGFNVDTPSQLLDLIKERIRTGKPVYGNEAMGARDWTGATEPLAEGGLHLRRRAGEAGYTDLIPDVIDFGKRVFEKGMDFAKWSAEMIKHLGEKVGEHLKTVWDSITGQNILPRARESGAIGGIGVRKRSQIEQSTGLRPTTAPIREQLHTSISKAQGLSEYLRGQEKGGIAGAKSKAQQLRMADKWMAADQEQVRQHMTDYVNSTLPPAERGRFIGAIGKALARPDLIRGDPTTMYRNAFRVMRAIENRSEVVYKDGVIKDIKNTITRSLESPSVDVSYRQLIRESTKDIGTTNPRESTIESMKKLNDHIEKLQASGEEVSADMLERVSGLSKVPLKDLTIPALESLRTKIQLLEKLGRENVKSRKIAWNREKADRVTEMKDAASAPLEKNPIFKPQPGERGDMTMMQRVGNWFNSGRNWFSGFEKAHAPMDEIYDLLGGAKGTYNGWLERNIRGPLDLSYNAEISEGTPIRSEAQRIITRNKLTNDDLEKIQVHGITEMDGGSQRLAEMGVSDDTIAKAKTLTPAQKEFYDYTRSIYDSLLPRIQRTAHALDNVEVKPVKNYVPLQRDWAAHAETETSIPGEITFDENATSRQVLNDIGASRISTKTKQGFTQSRVKNAVTAVRLNAADIFNRHLSDALHYIHTQPDLRMAGQIARSPEFEAKFGKQGQQIILDHLDSIARQGGVNRFQRLATLDWVRNATSKAQVGFRIASNLVHLSQIPLSITHAGGPGWWARGMRAALSEEGQAFIRQHAAETTVRSGGEPAQAEAEAISKVSKAGFAVARNIDRLDAQATFMGRYFKEMDAKGMSPDQALSAPIDEQAQMLSLARTRRAVASPLYKDVPQATARGLGYGGNVSVARAVNQFRNIFLDNWSNVRHDFFRTGIADAVKNGLNGDNSARIAAIGAATIMSIAAETGIKYGIKQGISAGISKVTGKDEKDDNHTLTNDFVHHLLNRIPFVGQAINAAIYGETGVPVIDAAVKPLHELAQTAKSKKPETKLKHELRAAGSAATVLGVPGIGQASDIAEKIIVPNVKKPKKENKSTGIKPFKIR